MILLKKQLKIILPLIICIVVSGLLIYFGKISYDNIITPKYAPPKVVFPIAWTIIYLIFYYSMLKTYDDNKTYALYVITLALHIIWNFTFFFMGYLLVGVLVLILIYFVSWIFVYYLSQNKKGYFYLNLPYLIWLMAALYLNIGVFLLN